MQLTDFPDHPFWEYSLRVYMTEGVGDACLELQEAHQLDVNVLLFCMWFSHSGRGALGSEDMKSVTGSVASWHQEVVRPLRAVRTRMKGGMSPAPLELSDSLRRRIQKIEIDCEHTEQLVLAGSVFREPAGDRPFPARVLDAMDSLGRYFDAIGASISDNDRTQLEVLMRVGFPELSPAEIKQLCGVAG